MLMPVSRFKSAVRAGERPVVTLQKFMSASVDSLDDRIVRFTISTASVDRDNDTVAVGGWNLTAFQKNPVVLWGHDYTSLPIGRCINIGVDGDALKADVDFVPSDIPEVGPRAEAILRMCRLGFLSATSVGFRPLAYEIDNDRTKDSDWLPAINYIKQELMEFSVVSIPANPEALIDPREQQAIPEPTADADKTFRLQSERRTALRLLAL